MEFILCLLLPRATEILFLDENLQKSNELYGILILHMISSMHRMFAIVKVHSEVV